MADSGRSVFGGASLGLPTPNFLAGWGPGFAFESSDGDLFGGTVLNVDTVYPIDADPAGTGTNDPEDNEWFSWAGPAEVPSLKRLGFYYVEFSINLAAPLSNPWECRIAGTTAIARSPGGFDRTSGTFVLPISAGVVGLTVDKLTNGSIDTTYASLVFVPLFTP